MKNGKVLYSFARAGWGRFFLRDSDSSLLLATARRSSICYSLVSVHSPTRVESKVAGDERCGQTNSVFAETSSGRRLLSLLSRERLPVFPCLERMREILVESALPTHFYTQPDVRVRLIRRTKERDIACNPKSLPSRLKPPCCLDLGKSDLGHLGQVEERGKRRSREEEERERARVSLETISFRSRSLPPKA